MNKIKVLIVIDSENSEPIRYLNKVDVDLQTEIRAALTELAHPYSPALVEEIEQDLLHGRAYWLEEPQSTDPVYCFNLITLD